MPPGPFLLAPVLASCPDARPLAPRSFGPVARVSSGPSAGLYSMEPMAALRPDGEVVITFMAHERIFHPSALATAVVRADGSIDGPRALRTDRAQIFDPWIASAADGTIAMVWLGHNGGRPDRDGTVGFSSSSDGRTFSPPVSAVDVAHDCPNAMPGCLDKPMVAIGPAPAGGGPAPIYVFYYTEAREGLRMTRSTDGGRTFGESVAVAADAYGDVVVDSGGVIHVALAGSAPGPGHPNRFGDARGRVFYVHSNDGGKSFSEARTVSADGEPIPFYFSNPQVVPDPARHRLHFVYPSGTPDGRWDIMIATTDESLTSFRRTRVNDDAPCAMHMTPTAALDPRSGRVHIIWADNRDGRGRMAYTSCDADGARCAANESLSDAPFARFSIGRHSPVWRGEYDALLVDERRGFLHAVWTQPVDEPDGPRSRIFHARRKLP
jgi:hypothetical protein